MDEVARYSDRDRADLFAEAARRKGSFDRNALGFGGENDPLLAPSGKKKRYGVEALVEACKRLIHETFFPKLHDTFSEALD